MASVSCSFRANKAFLLNLAKTLTRLDADMDRWHAVQEALRMAAPCIPGFEDRAAMSKWSLLLCIAEQTNLEKKIPECFAEDNDSIVLRYCTPFTDSTALTSLREHQEEFAQGARELELIGLSMRREGQGYSARDFQDLARATHLLNCLADEIIRQADVK